MTMVSDASATFESPDIHAVPGPLESPAFNMTQEECLRRFMAAVRDGRRGDYSSAKAIVESVRSKGGDEAAEVAKRELWAFIRSDKNTK